MNRLYAFVTARLGARAALLAAGLSACALLAAAGCRDRAAATHAEPAQARFVGNDACRECHPHAFELHAASRHNRTLHIANRAVLGALSPPDGPVSDSGYAIQTQGGRIHFAESGNPESSAEIQLALGSGKTGITYVGLFGERGLTEFRMSYFPSERIWYVTPGQEGRADFELGAEHNHAMARRCIGCHAVTVPDPFAAPDRRFFGVGCESCHGPGSLHVAAASVPGARDVRIERLGRLDGDRINTLCGKCHRTMDDISLVTREASATARFQPYGLQKSPCFQKSGGRLSCLTCHDPHTDASTDPRFYEKKCLGCHSPQGSNEGHPGAGIVCPVNPREKCIGCHMPRKRVLPGGNVPVTMTDHFIWAYGKKR